MIDEDKSLEELLLIGWSQRQSKCRIWFNCREGEEDNAWYACVIFGNDEQEEQLDDVNDIEDCLKDIEFDELLLLDELLELKDLREYTEGEEEDELLLWLLSLEFKALEHCEDDAGMFDKELEQLMLLKEEQHEVELDELGTCSQRQS